MYKYIVAAFAALLVTGLMVTPTLAEGQADVFQNQTGAKAGLYLSIPFAGGLKPSNETDMQYGLRMGYTYNNATGYSFTDSRKFNANMIDVKFKSDGFNSLNLGGQKFVNAQGQWLNATGGGGTNNMFLIIGGVALVGMGVVVLSDGAAEREIPLCVRGDRECECRVGILQDCGPGGQ